MSVRVTGDAQSGPGSDLPEKSGLGLSPDVVLTPRAGLAARQNKIGAMQHKIGAMQHKIGAMQHKIGARLAGFEAFVQIIDLVVIRADGHTFDGQAYVHTLEGRKGNYSFCFLSQPG